MWEQRRKIAKLSEGIPAHIHEALYTADVCKGHVSGHGSRVMEAWAARSGVPSAGYVASWD